MYCAIDDGVVVIIFIVLDVGIDAAANLVETDSTGEFTCPFRVVWLVESVVEQERIDSVFPDMDFHYRGSTWESPYKLDGKPKDWQETDEGNFRLTHPSNFWDDISVPFWSMKENTDHPTQKPEKLYAKLILASSNKGDMVFEPFSGSGTSCVTAKKLGRRYCGIEINEEYCLWAEKRLTDADDDKTIQGYFDGVFWERNSLKEQKKRG